MRNGKALFTRLAHEVTNADDHIRARHLEGQIVQRLFAESVEIGIPGVARANVVTSAARVVENLVADIFDADRMFLAQLRRFVEENVERTVFLLALLDKVQVFAILIADPRDAKSKQQSKFEQPFARNQRRKRNRSPAVKMVILGDHG